MGYIKIEATIIPAKHKVSVGEGFSSIAVKQAFANVPDNASLKSINKDQEGYIFIFEEAN